MADKKISALTSASTPLAGTEVLPIVQSGATVKVAVSDLTAGRAVGTAALTATGLITAPKGSSAGITIGDVTTNSNSVLRMQGTSAGYNWQIANNLNSSGIEFTQSTATGGTTYSTPKFEMLNTGNFNVAAGNVVMGTSGKGIDFSATSGSGTSELLSDYEEGTWTPQYTNTTPPTTPYTMTITSATYTKIGRLVTIVANIATSNVNASGASGTLRISGLPFTSAAHGVVNIGYSANWSTNFPSTGYVESGATTIALQYRATANGATAALNETNLTSGASAGQNVIIFTATYCV